MLGLQQLIVDCTRTAVDFAGSAALCVPWHMLTWLAHDNAQVATNALLERKGERCAW